MQVLILVQTVCNGLSVDPLLMVVIEVSGSLKEMNARYFKSLCCLILTKHFINIKCRNKLVLESSLSVFSNDIHSTPDITLKCL